MTYKYRNGTSTYRGILAEDAATELERIRQTHGGVLRTEDVWREAQSLTSPIHSGFTWDLQEAAQKCWEDEARYLVRFIFVQDKPQTELRPVYIHVHEEVTPQTVADDAVNYYQNRAVIVNQPDQLVRALQEYTTQLNVLQRAVEDIRLLMQARADPRLDLLLVTRDAINTAQAAMAGVI